MVSRASQLFKQMILNSYEYHVVKYRCGTIIEYSNKHEIRNICPICSAEQDILRITFLEASANNYGYRGEIFKDGKYK